MKKLEGPVLRSRSGQVNSAVILLHGYGDSGSGLIDLGYEWADGLPDTTFFAPNAIEPCEAWPSGYQWFGLRALDGPLNKEGLDRKEIIKPGAAALNAYIDDIKIELGLGEAQIAVAGFSQGAMMAMYTMPRRKEPCAGIIGYSGMLIDAEGLKAPDIVKPPVLVIHGADDEVVPPHFLGDARNGFAAANFNAETVLRPHLGHSIDSFGLTRGLQFLQEILKK